MLNFRGLIDAYLVGGLSSMNEKYAQIKMGIISPQIVLKIKRAWNHHRDI